MPIDFETIETAQVSFNTKYGVNFSIEEFDASISGFAELGGGIDADEMYKITFASLYQKAFANFIDQKLGKTFEFGEMIRDFDKSIMNPYRAECKKENKSAPKLYGGWTVKEYLESVDHSLDRVPNGKLDFAARRYREGDLRIRDMRAYAEALKKEDSPSADRLATLYCYTHALSVINQERSFFWKATHLFKYFAEKREAKNFKAYLAEVTGGELVERTGNEKFDEILARVKDSLIEQSRKVVKAAVSQAVANDLEKDAPADKEKLFVDAAAMKDIGQKTTAQVKETTSLAKENLNLKH